MTGIGDLPLWSRATYGPYRVDVVDGALDIDALRRTKGDPHLSGLKIVPVSVPSGNA
ncbi:MAG: hypothetical protein H0W72_04200 [Planctomycetes bacterium]|nr:hypothetical protein [Planctomycetota bacterium]